MAEELLNAQEQGSSEATGFEIQYPKENIREAEAWQPMIEYYRWLEGKSRTDKNQDGMRVYVNPDNCIDYAIFIEAVAGADNVFKNCCVSAIRSPGGYEIVKNPWDLNITFGNQLVLGLPAEEKNIDFLWDEVYETEYYFCADLKALLNENPAAVSEKLYTRWQELREECLSEEWILDALNRNLSLLRRSGAAVRDDAKWNTYGFGGDCEEMQAFIRKRMEILDDFYYNLYQENSQEKS